MDSAASAASVEATTAEAATMESAAETALATG